MATKRQTKKSAKKEAVKVTPVVEETVVEVAPVVEETVAETAPVVEETVVEAAPVVEEAVVEVAPVVEEAIEEKEPAKKAAPKKAAAKKEIKTSLFVEYGEKQVEDKAIVASVKKAWTKAGNKVGDIKTMALYVKPEEAAVYYVINSTETGKVEF